MSNIIPARHPYTDPRTCVLNPHVWLTSLISQSVMPVPSLYLLHINTVYTVAKRTANHYLCASNYTRNLYSFCDYCFELKSVFVHNVFYVGLSILWFWYSIIWSANIIHTYLNIIIIIWTYILLIYILHMYIWLWL